MSTVIIIRVGGSVQKIVGPFPDIKSAVAYGNSCVGVSWGWAILTEPDECDHQRGGAGICVKCGSSAIKGEP